MASCAQNDYFMGILCLILVLISGQVVKGIKEPFVCIGKCSDFEDCNKACISKGYQLGGYCYGFSVLDLACCCTKGCQHFVLY
ncbi:hypothetical protein CDL12_30331 [Handroanthus impetiginosus]|uniref:Knottin scorpion toxin-like domain-containing protein n=1 Tax=Handroanthus impetiginosus TaxID=429701 RepID=A0A2G9FW97_9LAMI|nr:hypothetical protein CDL12_30331 [Handroanthus impetiginosus]